MPGDKSYFIDPEAARAFDLSFMRLLGQLKDRVVARYRAHLKVCSPEYA